MNKIKALREKYRITKRNGKTKAMSQRQLGILIGYSKDQIYCLESGKRQITLHFEMSLKNVEILLRNGDVKIPK